MDSFAELKSAVDDFTATTTETLQETRKDLKGLRGEVDKIQLRMNRPGVLAGTIVGSPAGTLEAKAWVTFLRRGVERMDDLAEMKSLQTSSDPSGGYLAPPQFVAEVLEASSSSHRSARPRRWARPRRGR